jgi:hypothetical protein
MLASMPAVEAIAPSFFVDVGRCVEWRDPDGNDVDIGQPLGVSHGA